MTAQLLRRRFTVDEYHRMGQTGILDEDDRVELLEGEIVEMVPIGSRRHGAVNRLNELFSNRTTGRSIVSIQGPIRLGENSEPQPDVALLRRREDFYSSSHAEPGDVLLLVEVSDTTIDYDREVKLPLYARHGIAEVWLVDLRAGAVTAYWNPSANGYAQNAQHRSGGTLSPQSLPQIEVGVDEVIG